MPLAPQSSDKRTEAVRGLALRPRLLFIPGSNKASGGGRAWLGLAQVCFSQSKDGDSDLIRENFLEVV